MLLKTMVRSGQGSAMRAVAIAFLCTTAGTSQVSAQPAVAGRDAALARVDSELRGGGVLGRLVERTPGSLEFVPEGEALILPIANPDRIAPAAVGPVLRVTGDLDASSGEVELGDYRLDLVADLDASPALGGQSLARVRADPLLRELGTALSGLALAVDRALEPGAMSVEDLDPAGGGPVAAADRQATERFTDLYSRAVEAGNEVARDEIVARYADVRQQLKAIYGTYDNYPPWSYDQIYRNAAAAVAIGVPGAPQATCSGVLVGRDLVLTAGHCFRNSLPEELEVWFDFVEGQNFLPELQTRRITEVVAPSQDKRDAFFAQAFGRDLYDYAVVRFASDRSEEDLIPRVSLASCAIEPSEAPPEDATAQGREEWQRVREEWQARCVRQPQCLRDTRVRRGSALYVVGYPRGARETVHDNGRVYLPYQLTSPEFAELKLEIEADYEQHPDRERLLADFIASYVSEPPFFLLEDVRYGGQPKIGIVADTFRGNSGSPVYDRGNHCIVGMLLGGAEDRGERLLASWLHHESVLPVSAILADLEKHDDTRRLVEERHLTVE